MSKFASLFILIIVSSASAVADDKMSIFGGFGPMIGTIETGSGLAAGIRYNRSIFHAMAAYSTSGYQHIEFQVGWNPPKRGIFLRPIRYEFEDVYDMPPLQKQEDEFRPTGPVLYVEYRYRNLTKQDYYGLGQHSLKSDRADYQQQDNSFEVVGGYQLSPKIRFNVRAGYSLFNIANGHDSDQPDITQIFNDQSAPGLSDEPDFFHIGPAILFDFRNPSGDPESGGAVGASFTHFRPSEGQFSFQRYLIDGRYFVPMRAISSVAAFWFHTSLDSTKGENRIPFYLQSTLGGSQTLRGFPNFRFRQQKQVYLCAEYRWNVKSNLQIAAFYDTGKVFASPSDFDWRNLNRSAGAGIRIKAGGGVVMRIDYGHSAEDNRIVFRFSPTF